MKKSFNDMGYGIEYDDSKRMVWTLHGIPILHLDFSGDFDGFLEFCRNSVFVAKSLKEAYEHGLIDEHASAWEVAKWVRDNFSEYGK